VMAEPVIEDLDGDVAVDQAGGVRGAGWRCSGGEERQLPSCLGAPPNPRLQWRSGGRIRWRDVLLDEDDAGLRRTLL
jgi:hypothetical protein